jgi:D-beta-D-heptose 7-phosphate kinase/D-beta-D-heptose 1-phosphate adenosyltransferase
VNGKNELIFTNGCFDVIHRGHIELLLFCASLGEVIIGLNSDNSVKRLKGEGRPINSEIDRKYILESLECVSKVIIFEEDTPYELIKKVKPDLIVKGGDYTPDQVIGRDICKVAIFNKVKDYSTTNIVNNLAKDLKLKPSSI